MIDIDIVYWSLAFLLVVVASFVIAVVCGPVHSVRGQNPYRRTVTTVEGGEVPILRVATGGLHRYRGHDTRTHKIGRALSSGGMSLLSNGSCPCEKDATAMLAALLDEGYVVVKEAPDVKAR